MMRLFNRMLASAIALALFLCLAANGLGEGDYQLYYCTARKLNVRFGPSKHSPVEGSFERGDEVTVYEIVDGWARVDTLGQMWCSTDHLSSYKPEEGTKTGYIRSDGRVAVRKTIGGKLVRWVKNGRKVEILAEIDGWVRVADGYIDGTYVER